MPASSEVEMNNGFTLSEILNATPSEIYNAWLTSKGHSAMTGSLANVDGRVGGKFTAWDGYIAGSTLELTPDQRIVQAWRTSDISGRCT
jgi:activator of HSP90 ATPase